MTQVQQTFIRPQDASYEGARVDRIFNKRRPDKFPSGIAFPESEEEVVEAVRYATSQNKRISVRSGGHSWAAWSLQEDCVLIDTSKLTTFELDAENKVATVTPSMTGGKLNGLLIGSGTGLSFMGGHCPDVGLGGFLLQGGQGWGCRYIGWACEQIESFRVVLPPSEKTNNKVCVTECSRTTNPDLFWAARGCGPGWFGVITSFTLRLRSVPKLAGSVYFFDTAECYDELAPWYLQRCRDFEGRAEIVMIGFRSDQVMPHLSPVRNLLMIRPLLFDYETVEENEKKLAEFEQGMPFLGSQHNHLRVFNEHSSMAIEYERQYKDNPDGRYWVQNAWLDGPLDKVADTMAWAYKNIPSKATFVLHYSMDSSLRPALPKDMCFDVQTDHTYSIYSIAPPDTRDEDEACSSFVEKAFEIVDSRLPSEGGPAGIYLGDSDLSKRRTRFMGEENWKRWTGLRREYDPSRVFVGYDGEDDKEDWNKDRWELKN